MLDLSRIVGGRLRWQVVHGLARQVGVRMERVLIKRFLQRHQVEVVMGEYLDFSMQWLGIARELGLPFFAHGHGHDVSGRLRDPQQREQYLRYEDGPGGIITVSRYSRDRLIQEVGLNASRIHVVPCAVEVPGEPVARPEREQIRCLAVGRMAPQKAPILLLDSFRRAAERLPSLLLDFIGDGPLLPAVQEFIRAFHLEDRVTLHGVQANRTVIEFLERADVFLQHSITDPNTGDQEGLPVAILEAMAHALPVVSTREAGIPEAVGEGSTGFLVDPGDTSTMADHILTLAADPDLRHRMGEAGWRRAQAHFTWERERSELLRVLGLSA
jgi:colanic acid/amylovoran biosynthesis glycosyltransferase